MRSRNLAVLLSVLSLCTVAACGSGSDKDTNTADSGSSSLKGQRITFVNFGGDSIDAATKGWLEPFSKQTGVQYATDSPSDEAKVKAMVQAGRTTWDLMDYVSEPSQCGKLYAKRPANFDLSHLDPKTVGDDCGIPIIKQTVALVYNKAKFGDNPPTSLSDFMDTKKFPGTRLAFNYWAGTIEPLLMADGVDVNQLYPVDWNHLQSIFDKLGDDLVLSGTLDEMNQKLISGDFSMCLCYLGRTALAADQGAKVGVVYDSVFDAYDTVYAIKGSKYPKAQMAFLQFLATPEGQNGYYKYLPYGTMTIDGASPEVKAAWQPYVEQFNKDKIKVIGNLDTNWYDANAAETADKWAAITSG